MQFSDNTTKHSFVKMSQSVASIFGYSKTSCVTNKRFRSYSFSRTRYLHVVSVAHSESY